LHQVKVVILGQDPYHGPGQAHGLAFSVPPGVRVPPSLRNIFKEVNNDPLLDRVHRSPPVNGSLERWARQGVLLLNTCLTVEDGEPASHAQKGWEVLTDLLVSAVVARSSPAVFLLWGAHAQAKKVLLGPFVDASPNGCTPAPQVKSVLLALSANHPSPLSATRPPLPFIGCSHFGRVNQFLERHHQSAIDW